MKLRIYLLMSALFVLGIVCGVLFTIGFAKNQIRTISGSSTPEVSSMIVKFLDHRLRLSDEQEEAIEQVLREGEKEAMPLRREFRERIFEIFKVYRPKIAGHLDESQRQEFEQIVRKLLDTWQLQENPDLSPTNQ